MSAVSVKSRDSSERNSKSRKLRDSMGDIWLEKDTSILNYLCWQWTLNNLWCVLRTIGHKLIVYTILIFITHNGKCLSLSRELQIRATWIFLIRLHNVNVWYVFQIHFSSTSFRYFKYTRMKISLSKKKIWTF